MESPWPAGSLLRTRQCDGAEGEKQMRVERGLLKDGLSCMPAPRASSDALRQMQRALSETAVVAP
eukprot:6184715-Pleurochrysis_carterae.AAC.2